MPGTRPGALWGVVLCLCFGAGPVAAGFPPGAGDLYQENFNSGRADFWSNPGDAWRVVGGELRRTDLTQIPFPRAVYVGPGATDWTHYLFECDFRILSATRGNNEVGFYFRFRNDNNYYKLYFECINGGCAPRAQLIRVVGGSVTYLLADLEWALGHGVHRVAVAIAGARLDVFIDGLPIYNGTDGGLTAGTIGVVADKIDAAFDNVRVSSLVPGPEPPPRPVVDGLDPYEGSFHQLMTVHGAGFGLSRETAEGWVLFGSVPALVVSWRPNSIVCRAPEVESAAVRVVAFDQISVGDAHRFRILPPSVLSAEPSPASVGDVVVLQGEHFGFAPGQFGRVRANGLPAVIVSWQDDEVRFVMPDVSGDHATLKLNTVAGEDTAHVTILQPIYITCEVAPPRITLGEGLTFSGSVTTRGEAPLAARTVLLGLVSPRGEMRTVGATMTGFDGGYQDTHAVSAQELPYPISEPGVWQAAAFTPEDGRYRAASVLSPSFMVDAIACRLVLETSPAGVVHYGRAVEFAGRLMLTPNTPAALTFVEGATVAVTALAPGGQIRAWEAEVSGGTFKCAPMLLDQLGPWRLSARFHGNRGVLPSATAELAVQAVAELGYAIVVAGRVPSGEGLEEHARTTDNVVSRLLASNFAPENILYLNGKGKNPGGVAQATVSKAAVEQAITGWAAELMAQAPAPLFLVWVNHGDVVDGTGRFHVGDQLGQGADGYVTPAELDGWLDGLEAELAARNPAQTAGLPIVFVYGACHSGSFLPTLSEPGKRRILLASSDAYEVSYRGPADRLPRDGDYFITRFFEFAGDGHTLLDSFRMASEEVRQYTRNRDGRPVNGRGQNRYSDGSDQHPQLDDNGDGVSEAIPLAHDGDWAARLRLSGLSPADASDRLAITLHATDYFLAPGGPDPLLWVTVSDLSRLRQAWIEIRLPGAAPPPAALSESFQRVEAMPRFLAEGELGASLWWMHYEREDFPGFTEPGEYQVYYFVEDVSGRLAPVRSSRVFRNRTGNLPPEPFSLVKPADNAVVDVFPCFEWQDAGDPDGDPVSYVILLSESAQFPYGTMVVETGGEPLLFAGRKLPLADGRAYYWKVIARDAYGATRESRQVFRLRTDTVNDVFGSLLVRIYDGSTGGRVPNASVRVQPEAPLWPSSTGSFVGLGLPIDSDYWLTVEAAGYRRPEPRRVVIRTPDQPAVADYYLYRPGDVDEDGRMGPEDLLSFSQQWQRRPGGTADLNQDGICDEADLLLWFVDAERIRNEPGAKK